MSAKDHVLRIPKSIVKMLNDQISQENLSSFAYLSQAIWCDKKGFSGAAKFLYKQSDEERAHMLKIITYLTEQEATPLLPVQQKGVASASYDSLHKIFSDVVKNEAHVTDAIHKIVAESLACKDYRTFSFLQWFLEEQREEEHLAQKAINLFDIMAKDGGIGLYTIDCALGKLIEEEQSPA